MMQKNKKTILITAPQHYRQRMEQAFAPYHEVMTAVYIPMIASEVSVNHKEMLQWAGEVATFDYVVCVSRRAIDAAAQYLNAEKASQNAENTPSAAAFIAIGKDNEYMKEQLGVTPFFVSDEASPQGIANEIKRRGNYQGKRIAVIAPEFIGINEPDTVPSFTHQLQEMGMEVSRINAYATVATPLSERKEAYDRIINQEIDCVAFTSGGEMLSFDQGLKEAYGTDAACILESIHVACMGPYTARQARNTGINITSAASAYSSFDDFTQHLASL